MALVVEKPQRITRKRAIQIPQTVDPLAASTSKKRKVQTRKKNKMTLVDENNSDPASELNEQARKKRQRKKPNDDFETARNRYF